MGEESHTKVLELHTILILKDKQVSLNIVRNSQLLLIPGIANKVNLESVRTVQANAVSVEGIGTMTGAIFFLMFVVVVVAALDLHVLFFF